MSGAMLETMDHDHHRMRRNAVSGFFSKRAVQILEPLVVQKVDRLMERMRSAKNDGDGVVNLNHAYAAMTMDIISEYCFGEPMKALDRPEYGKEFVQVLHQGVGTRPLARQFPTFMNLLFDLPPDLVAKLNPSVALLNSFNLMLLGIIEKIFKHEDETSEGGKVKRTVFHEIRDGVSGKLPDEEKTPYRLMAEGSVLMGAGTETTARTLAVTTFYLLQNRPAGDKLLEELRTVLPTKATQVSLPQLEALPYLVSTLSPLHALEGRIIDSRSDCSNQRRPSCRPRSLLPSTSYPDQRIPVVPTFHHPTRHPGNAVGIPPAH